MRQSGITTDDRPVVADVFPLVGTRGVPLDIVLGELLKAGFVVDWQDFVRQALADGANPERLRTKILDAVSDIHGVDYTEQVGVRLEKLFVRMGVL